MHKHQLDAFPFLTAFAEQKEEDETKVVVAETETDENEGGDIELVIPDDLTELPDEELASLHAAAAEAFTALYGEDGSGLTEEGLTALSVLTEGIEKVQTELDSRAAAEAERTEAATALASRVGVKKAEPVAPEAVEEPTPEQEKTNEIRLSLSGLRQRRPAAPTTFRKEEDEAPQGPTQMKDIVKAAPEFNGFATGAGLDWTDIGKGLDRRLAGFNRNQWDQANKAGRHMRVQQSMAVIQKPFDPSMVLQSDAIGHIDDVLQRASKESRLPGNSLVAAGGWCAPSETIYDLCELESTDGLYSLPEINVTRGGIKYTQGPNFADIYNNTGFSYTEAEDIAGDYDGSGGGTKPCYQVDCPDFTEVRLGYSGVCITAGLLQQRGYPEVIARTVRGALVAHEHKMSEAVLQAVVAGSTAVTMPAGQVGAAAPLLTAIELQAEHYRSSARIARSTSLEAVFPFWVRGAVRADLSRRLGVDMMSVSDAQIDDWFRTRGVNPQFVYGLQDLTGAASAVTAYPASVDFLLYAAGAWVKGASDIITLDTLYDSVKLGTNDYTALFTEEGWLVANLCHDSRVVTVPLCADGGTHGGVDIACDGSLAPATP